MSGLTVTAQQLNFALSTKVVSGAQKFVAPVPALAGEKLVYPAGARGKGGEDLSGQAIRDWEGKPIGETGVVFFNGKDKAWQAVPSDGNGVVIINQVTEKQARQLYSKWQALGGAQGISLTGFKEFLAYANELGLGDKYNSDKGFVGSKMTPVLPRGDLAIEGMCGYVKRDDRDICDAVFIGGAVTFEGPAATPQMFDGGAVIVRQGKDIRGIQPDAFAQTYRLADGTPISDVSSQISHFMSPRF